MNSDLFGRAGARGRNALVQTQQNRAYDAGFNAPQVDHNGSVFRTVPTDRWDSYADHRWSDIGGGRYNDPGQRLIYTSPSRIESAGEMSAYSNSAQPMSNQTMVEMNYDANGRMADVSGNLDNLGVNRSALTARKGGNGPDWFHRLTGEDPYLHSRAVGQGTVDAGASSMRVPSATGGNQIDIIPNHTNATQLEYVQHLDFDASGKPTTIVDAAHLHQHSSGGPGRMPLPDATRPVNNPPMDYVNPDKVSQRSGSARYAAAAAGGMSAIDNIQAFTNGEISAIDAIGDTGLDTGVGALTGMADDALTARFGGGMSGGLKAGAVIDAVTSGAFSTWDNAEAYRNGDIGASQATANVAVDTGVGVASGMAGMAAGAAIGSVIPVAGTAAGALIGFGAGMLGSWAANSALTQSGFSDWAKEGLGGALSNYDETLSSAWEGISSATEWMGDTASSAWEGTKDIASDIGSGISSGASAVWEGTQDIASDIGSGISSGASAAWEGTQNIASDIGSSISSGASAVWDTVTGW